MSGHSSVGGRGGQMVPQGAQTQKPQPQGKIGAIWFGCLLIPVVFLFVNVTFGGNGLGVIAQGALERSTGTSRTILQIALYTGAFILIFVQSVVVYQFSTMRERLAARQELRERIGDSPSAANLTEADKDLLRTSTFGIIWPFVAIVLLWALDLWIVAMGYTYWQTGELSLAKTVHTIPDLGADFWVGLFFVMVINLLTEPTLVNWRKLLAWAKRIEA